MILVETLQTIFKLRFACHHQAPRHLLRHHCPKTLAFGLDTRSLSSITLTSKSVNLARLRFRMRGQTTNLETSATGTSKGNITYANNVAYHVTKVRCERPKVSARRFL